MRSYLKSGAGEFGLWAFVMAGLTVLMLASGASAATYNFYFNNTEQGDNSTATPALNVQDGKNVSQAQPAAAPQGAPVGATENTAPAAPADAIPAEPVVQPASLALPPQAPALSMPITVPEPAPASNSSSAVMNEVSSFSRREYRPFRLMLGAAVLAEQTTYSYDKVLTPYSGSYERLGSERVGAAASLALFLSRRSAINVFIGIQEFVYSDTSGTERKLRNYAGVELELMPIHLSLFGVEDIFEAGLLLGATTLRKSEGNIAAAQAGVRVNFNFGNDISLTAAGRGNLGFLMGEAGLAFRI